MKKIGLLIITLSLSGVIFAQSSGKKSIIFTNNADQPARTNNERPILANIPTAHPISTSSAYSTKGARTTAVQGRWYRYCELADLTIGFIANNNLSWSPMWWDSTTRYRYSDGSGGTILEAAEWAGFSQLFDPIRFTSYNDTDAVDGNGAPFVTGDDIAIKNTNAYTVDTIQIRAAYIRMINRPDSVVDTLIVTVAPQNTDYFYDSTGNSWIFNNTNVLGTVPGATRIYTPQVKYADSILRGVLPDNAVSGAHQTVDTFFLTNADRHLPDFSSGSEADTLQLYQLPIRHGAGNTIPAGQRFAVSVSFKSGGTWVPNIDSIRSLHRFCPVFGFQLGSSSTSSGWMPYMYGLNPDYNGTSYLDARGRPSENLTTYPYVNHSGHPARWLSQFVAQDLNGGTTAGNGYFDQFMWMNAHVSCSGCSLIRQVVSVNNVPTIITKVQAFPNPATDKLTVGFTLGQSTDVTIALTNAMGQVIETQKINNVSIGKAEFNVATLSSGVYFFTVNANGEHHTGRITIAH